MVSGVYLKFAWDVISGVLPGNTKPKRQSELYASLQKLQIAS